MTKKIRKGPVYMPIDVLKIDANQRYNTKLSDTQTSNMIKFAVTLPKDRWAAVQHGVRLLNWPNDPYLRHYGLQVNSNAAKVKARVLPSPQVHFGPGSKEAQLNPRDMIQGRWRLDGKKFAVNNKDRPIKAWGVCCIQGRGCEYIPAVLSKFQQLTPSQHPLPRRLRLSSPSSCRSTSPTVERSWLIPSTARSLGWDPATCLTVE
jgi:eukaryotic translation initiation factor 2C